MSKEGTPNTATPRERLEKHLAAAKSRKLKADVQCADLEKQKAPVEAEQSDLNGKWLPVQKRLRELRTRYDELDVQHEVAKRDQGRHHAEIGRLTARLKALPA